MLCTPYCKCAQSDTLCAQWRQSALTLQSHSLLEMQIIVIVEVDSYFLLGVYNYMGGYIHIHEGSMHIY